MWVCGFVEDVVNIVLVVLYSAGTPVDYYILIPVDLRTNISRPTKKPVLFSCSLSISAIRMHTVI